MAYWREDYRSIAIVHYYPIDECNNDLEYYVLASNGQWCHIKDYTGLDPYEVLGGGGLVPNCQAEDVIMAIMTNKDKKTSQIYTFDEYLNKVYYSSLRYRT